MIVKILSHLAKVLWVKELGWTSGLILILIIYVHEFGHYLIAESYNLKPKLPRFIPFLGAYVMHDKTLDCKKQYDVALAGPFVGGVLGIISFYIDLVFDSNIFYQIAVFSIFLNFFNLIPFSLLDGGRVVNALGFKSFQLFVTIVLMVVAVVSEVYMIMIIGALGILSYFRNKKEKLEPMSKKEKRSGIFEYLLLILILGSHTFYIIIEHYG